MAPPRNVPNKFDPSQLFRSEIEERTAQGESCEQIASALRAKGVDITNKTISRRRVEWGFRKRPFSKRLGMKATKTRPKQPHTKNARSSARKAEIEARTRRGETAEQIAAALEAQGHEFKNGESTVLRLQTTWGLIPPDEDRARGRKRKARAERAKRNPASPKLSKREQEREANKKQQNSNLHYPTNCSFGPKKRVNGTTVDSNHDVDIDSHDQPRQLLPSFEEYSIPAQNTSQTTHPSVSVAAEIMSVEFLVDLATSTLGAATNLKDMLLAYQARQPASNSLTGIPPTLEELSTARRKVREAAAVMHDLAVDPVADAGPN